MILGKSLEKIISELGGRRRAMNTKTIARHINRHHGISADTRLRKFSRKSPMPERALFKLAWRTPEDGRIHRDWHWVYWDEGRFWDPADPRVRSIDDLEKGSWELTSYIEIRSVR
jgi:hypothetical protein